MYAYTTYVYIPKEDLTSQSVTYAYGDAFYDQEINFSIPSQLQHTAAIEARRSAAAQQGKKERKEDRECVCGS